MPEGSSTPITPWLGPGFGGGTGLALSGLEEVLAIAPSDLDDTALPAMRAFASHVPSGGRVVGLLGYELARVIEPSLRLPPAPDDAPAVWMGRFAMAAPCDAPRPSDSQRVSLVCDDAVDRADYEGRVADVIASIRRGDLFQANVSRRLQAHGEGAPMAMAAAVFDHLIADGVDDYAALLPVGKSVVLSNSPELFVSVQDGRVTAEPVKGTARRATTPDEDRRVAERLRDDPKERAENIMIADLLRNDLSKVCRDHSVEEPEICSLRTLPEVHHLYSRITGMLRDGITPLDAALAAFPCGSITGAPKVRAMEVIAALEKEGRGPYCGSIFCLDDQGGGVFSVAIRTGVLSPTPGGARLDVRAGGGVTVLSNPSKEYDETVAKAYPFRAMTS